MKLMEFLNKELVSKRDVNIIFIGDSITSTEWVHPNWREIVEYVIKEELTKKIKDWKIPSWGIRCFNYGFDGSTTEDILRMIDRISHVKPTITIYLENTNEIHYDFTPEQHKKNVEKLISALTKKDGYFVLCNSICGNNEEYNKKLSKYSQIVRKIKFDDKILFVDTFKEYSKYDLKKFFTFKSLGNDALKMKPGSIDFVHPNSLGNAYIAKIILEEAFNIKFNPEKFIAGTLSGKMYPDY